MRRQSILNTSRNKAAVLAALALSAAAVFLAIAAGSVFVSPREVVSILTRALAGLPSGGGESALKEGIILDLRLPRVLLAFVSGAALSVSGAVMQSVLKNPLASPFTLGVSSGASLGAALAIISGLTVLPAGLAAVPAAGFAASVLTIAFLLRFSRAIDPRLEGNTVILAGMVLSLFLNAALTLFSALSKEGMNRLLFWQMGSFALKGTGPLVCVACVTLVATAAIYRYRRELDILTFGDDEAVSLGVPAGRTRAVLITLASVMTGTVVSFVGVIGFLDLAVPHVARKAFGPAHRVLIPLSALLGGSLMVLADLLARVLIPPLDLPVGAITAILGTPFFAHVYLSSGRRDR